MAKDLSFLQIKDDDSDSITALKTRWQYLMELPKSQRIYELQLDKIREEERYLNWMATRNKQDDNLIAEFTNRARMAITNFEIYNDHKSLDMAETWAELAQGLRSTRFTIGDIRKQRERVQWEKKKLSQMTKPS